MTEDQELVRLVQALPKAELHVHLEGAIRPSTFLRLAKKNHINVAVTDEAKVADYFTFRDFEHFMRLYGETTYVLAEPEDFVTVTKELGLDGAANGVGYMEVTFTAGTHYRFKGIPFDELIEAINEGAEAAKRECGIEMRFIIDHVRGFPLEAAMQTAEWCVSARSQGVVAMGLGGFEPNRPASMYREVFQWLHQHEVPLVPHAGEAAGADSVWDALEFDPPRLGHGFRAAEDDLLIAELRRRGTVLELCPTSNVRTGVIANVESLPFHKLRNAGIPLTLNTDDPTMFNTTLNREYITAARCFGLGAIDLAQLSLTALNAGLVDESVKLGLRSSFIKQFEGLGVAISDLMSP